MNVIAKGAYMIEREIRFKINNEIKEKIINSSKLVREKEICVDLCMGKYGFDSLDKLGYIIRIRNKNNKIFIESKRRLDNNSWNESTIKLDDINQGYEFLKNIGLEPYLYINRKREERSIKEAKIFIDEIELLGTYVEFELEEGFEPKDLKKYLKENNITGKPDKLYGDIFKEKMKSEEFKKKFENSLNNFLKDKRR